MSFNLYTCLHKVKIKLSRRKLKEMKTLLHLFIENDILIWHFDRFIRFSEEDKNFRLCRSVTIVFRWLTLVIYTHRVV